MDDGELMNRLTASAPSVVPRDGRLHAAVDDVVTESRRPRPRRKRLFITGATLSVLLLGGTTTALATPSLLDWLRFTPDQTIEHMNADGHLCAAGMIVRPEGVPDDDASFLAAREIFLAIDFATLKIPGHIRKHWDSTEKERAEGLAEFNAAHPEAPIDPERQDPDTDMLIHAAYELMTTGVKAKGLDESHFSLEAGGHCDEATR
jgi:hypothetical protein